MKTLKILLLISSLVNASRGFDLCSQCSCSRNSIECSNLDELESFTFNSDAVNSQISSVDISNCQNLKFLEFSEIQITQKLEIQVANSSSAKISFPAGSFSLASKDSSFSLSLEDVKEVHFGSEAIKGSSGGSVDISIVNSESITVDSDAFEVLHKVRIDKTDRLVLAEKSFKPKIQSFEASLSIAVENAKKIASAPKNVFGSANLISFKGCQIGSIESGAFSGNVMRSIRFVECDIEKIQSNAFSGKSLIVELLISRSNVSSIAEQGVKSAISNLTFHGSSVSSMSKGALDCHVAAASFDSNLFRTLSDRSMSLVAWNSISFTNNEIQFMDQGSLMGIADPDIDQSGESMVKFEFSENVVGYANSNSMRVKFPETEVDLTVEGNYFENKECDCYEFEAWIKAVSGATLRSDNLMSSALKNASVCKLSSYDVDCYQSLFDDAKDDRVRFQFYSEKLCERGTTEVLLCDSDTSTSNEGGEVFEEKVYKFIKVHLRAETTRGLLILILIFAILASLVVSICTLLRWICWTIYINKKARAEALDAEWNFTKIEERRLVNDNDTLDSVVSNTPVKSQNTEDHYEELPAAAVASTSEESVKQISSEASSGASEAKVQNRKSNNVQIKSRPPTEGPTFFDEMIGMLREKLDDPDNYATVADLSGANNTESQGLLLYQDPQSVLKPEEESGDKKSEEPIYKY